MNYSFFLYNHPVFFVFIFYDFIFLFLFAQMSLYLAQGIFFIFQEFFLNCSQLLRNTGSSSLRLEVLLEVCSIDHQFRIFEIFPFSGTLIVLRSRFLKLLVTSKAFLAKRLWTLLGTKNVASSQRHFRYNLLLAKIGALLKVFKSDFENLLLRLNFRQNSSHKLTWLTHAHSFTLPYMYRTKIEFSRTGRGSL